MYPLALTTKGGILKMKTVIYKSENYKADRSAFGGELSQFDFDGHHTLSSMADKIAADWRFDEMCRKNIVNGIYTF